MREISIAEMRHIEEFSDRILFLQGDVDMNASFRTRQVTDVKEMLRMAMQLEQSTIDSYNEASRIAAGEQGRRNAQDVSGHHRRGGGTLDTFRTELQNLIDYGESTWRCSPPRAASIPPKKFQPFRRRRIPVARRKALPTQKTESFAPGPVFSVIFVPESFAGTCANPRPAHEFLPGPGFGGAGRTCRCPWPEAAGVEVAGSDERHKKSPECSLYV